jgi:hypothetical protein
VRGVLPRLGVCIGVLGNIQATQGLFSLLILPGELCYTYGT